SITRPVRSLSTLRSSPSRSPSRTVTQDSLASWGAAFAAPACLRLGSLVKFQLHLHRFLLTQALPGAPIALGSPWLPAEAAGSRSAGDDHRPAQQKSRARWQLGTPRTVHHDTCHQPPTA